MSLRSRALMMSSARAGIGVASIFAPSVSARITGYPAEHDNATSRMVGRLFGVRELLLAWLVVDAVRRPEGAMGAPRAPGVAPAAGRTSLAAGRKVT